MRKRLLTCVQAVVLGLAVSSPILASDMTPPPASNWGGFYVGVQGGYAWGDSEHDFTFGVGKTGSWDIEGGFVGGTVGYNWQPTGSKFLVGVEGDGAWAEIDGNSGAGGVGCNTGSCFTEIEALATLRGRIGLVHEKSLFYVTGGAAFAEIDAGVLNSADRGSETFTGWTIGGGVEYAITPQLSAKAEYLYVDFGDDFAYNVGAANRTDAEAQLDVLRLGVNYRFGGNW